VKCEFCEQIMCVNKQYFVCGVRGSALWVCNRVRGSALWVCNLCLCLCLTKPQVLFLDYGVFVFVYVASDVPPGIARAPGLKTL
jgi:hypothetical protein